MDYLSQGVLIAAAVFISGTVVTSDPTPNPASIRLPKYLVDNYARVGSEGSPGKANQSVEVNMRLSLMKIYQVDVDMQQMVTQAMVFLTWTDSRLSWNPASFEGIQDVVIPADVIWLPDIVLFNTEAPAVEMFSDLKVTVKSNGEVTYVPVYKLTSSCEISEDSQNEPKCPLKFGSLSYPSSKLNLINKSGRADALFFTSNPHYEVLSMISEGFQREPYMCCPGVHYKDLVFTIHLRRRVPIPDPNAMMEGAATRATLTSLPVLVAALTLLAAVH